MQNDVKVANGSGTTRPTAGQRAWPAPLGDPDKHHLRQQLELRRGLAAFSQCFSGVVNDFRYALRTLGRNRGFTVIATLTLALGIGLNAAIFSMINGLILKPLEAADGERLVWIASASSEPDGPRGNLTVPDFNALRDRKDVLADAF